MNNSSYQIIDKIESVLINEGQHDKVKFRLGEEIKYNPHEVKKILLKYAAEIFER